MKVKLKKGYDMPLAGEVEDQTLVRCDVSSCALYPEDYPGFVPKLMCREGDRIEAGAPVLYHRDFPDVKICSPLSGIIKKVCRGERRRLLYVEIETANRTLAGEASRGQGKGARRLFPTEISRADIVALLCGHGFFAWIRQRPYDVVPDPAVSPRDIFVTAIDSAPLACGLLHPCVAPVDDMLAGLETLGRLTDGKVYLSVRENETVGGESLRRMVERQNYANVEVVDFSGKHPVGNAGIQASHIRPVSKGDVIWTLDVRVLCKIGKFFRTEEFDANTVVAVCGPEVSAPVLVETLEGAPVGTLLAGRLKDDGKHKRIISGNVLTGYKVSEDDYMHFPWRQLTVIAEGDDVDEFLGWASVSPSKLSAGKTFPLNVFKKRFSPDARMLGGRRAMILSGVYDRMVPMDILPEYLIRAIIGRDIDAMEKLGIYEVAPEDFALAEFADPSKLPLQNIVREGLDWLRKENG